MNQFSVFNGLNKFYDQAINAHDHGFFVLDEATLKEYKENGALINSNLDHRQHELMKVFNCNPDWPICIYDFTFKNKSTQFLTMKCKKNLSDYVVEDYFGQRKVNSKLKRNNLKETELDVLREHMHHLCCCQNNSSKQEKELIYKFLRNFKILFIKSDNFLFKNKNLKFLLDNDMDIQEKIKNFTLEIAGLKASGGVSSTKKEFEQQIDSYELIRKTPTTLDEFGFKDLGEVVGSKFYAPSKADFRLLIGTKEWLQVKQNEGVDESTYEETREEQVGTTSTSMRKSEQQSSSSGNNTMIP